VTAIAWGWVVDSVILENMDLIRLIGRSWFSLLFLDCTPEDDLGGSFFPVEDRCA
jgi:hypothetical protein